MIDIERRDRVRRWTRRAELVRRPSDQPENLEHGRWVVVTDRYKRVAPSLALLITGPDLIDAFGTMTEWWTTHDDRCHERDELTVLDLADVLGEAIGLLANIRAGRYRPGGDQTSILRVHRTACLANQVPCRDRLATDVTDVLDAIVHIDWQIAESEADLVALVRERLPNLVRAIALAAAIELAREPGWEPNTAGIPHPWLKRERRHLLGVRAELEGGESPPQA